MGAIGVLTYIFFIFTRTGVEIFFLRIFTLPPGNFQSALIEFSQVLIGFSVEILQCRFSCKLGSFK